MEANETKADGFPQAEARKPGAIGRSIGILSASSGKVRELADDLLDRLAPVMKPGRNEQDIAPKEVKGPECKISDDIYDNVSKIDIAINTLEQILQRLEL